MGVTNACPRPGLSALYQEHVCPSPRPGTWAGAGGRPGPPWKHAHAHVCTLLSNTHAHTRYILLCTCFLRTHIHTDTVIHRQHCVHAQCTTTHGRTRPHLCAHSIHVPIFTHCTQFTCPYILTYTGKYMLTCTHTNTHTYIPTHIHSHTNSNTHTQPSWCLIWAPSPLFVPLVNVLAP